MKDFTTMISGLVTNVLTIAGSRIIIPQMANEVDINRSARTPAWYWWGSGALVTTFVGVLAIAYASADDSKEPNVKISDSFRLQCEGSLPKPEAAVLIQEVPAGFKMDLGDFEFEGTEGGKLSVSSGSDHSRVNWDEKGKTFVEQGGFRYDISSKKGLNGGTEVTVSRGCERR